MCLHLLKKPRIQRRNRPVAMFKVLRCSSLLRNQRFEAPFRYTRYRLGETKQVQKFSGTTVLWRQKLFRDTIPADIDRHINRGLHGYETVAAARRGAYWGGRIIVRCVIPPDTPFIRGKKGEIVALALVVGKAVYGQKSLCRKFNGE